MKTICTRCKSDQVSIQISEEKVEVEETQTMDEMIENLHKSNSVNAVYTPKTWVCKACGYSVTEGARASME